MGNQLTGFLLILIILYPVYKVIVELIKEKNQLSPNIGDTLWGLFEDRDNNPFDFGLLCGLTIIDKKFSNTNQEFYYKVQYSDSLKTEIKSESELIRLGFTNIENKA